MGTGRLGSYDWWSDSRLVCVARLGGWLTGDLRAWSGASGAEQRSGSGREEWCGLGWSNLVWRRHGPEAALCKGTVG